MSSRFRLISLTFVLFLCTLLPQKSVLADVINPEYRTAHCEPGEVMVGCNWRINDIGGPIVYDNCEQYKHNPNYRYLDSEGHTFGGSAKYCQISHSPITVNLYTLLPPLFTTFTIELIVILLFGFRTRKFLLTFLGVNIISVIALNMVLAYIASGYPILLALEIGVVVFEYLILSLVVPKPKQLRLFFAVITANLLSATVGSVALHYLYNFF